ncbi:hypothetical protein BU14_0431s0013 [Porphyra umbilicalis]|uniref:Beta-carotene isomerase D27-like C-terminal domain-containing protein n=1 Tax=Porphyra umbilicalis TaxID=2786 RepID=A0A1X6NV37_PORUM|nr:hypothetical protein BU14_0431s0013 [Porphyra umbilicalis]|eukprot:OSX72489.1 hypothetical protein BU14_0431s0013 [Porphyra umbilicalis]
MAFLAPAAAPVTPRRLVATSTGTSLAGRPRVCGAPRRHAASMSASAGSSPPPVVRVPRTPSNAPLEVRGPTDAPPDYTAIDEELRSRVLLSAFRNALIEELAPVPPPANLSPGFNGSMELVSALSAKYNNRPRDLTAGSLRVLYSLFPEWILVAFRNSFAVALPGVSARLNAAVTSLTSRWLMGPNTLNEGGKGVLVERCRYLEATGCVSTCVNGCKVPTETFLKEGLGVDLWMQPNYDTFECQFSFGTKPPPVAEDPAFDAGCMGQCKVAQQRMRVEAGRRCTGNDAAAMDRGKQ